LGGYDIESCAAGPDIGGARNLSMVEGKQLVDFTLAHVHIGVT
jgi:hypothetical protein